MKGQLIVRIDGNLKKRFQMLSRREGKSMSEKVIGLVEEYVSDNDFPGLVDRVWDRVGSELRTRGYGPKDVGKTIREARVKKPGPALR